MSEVEILLIQCSMGLLSIWIGDVAVAVLYPEINIVLLFLWEIVALFFGAFLLASRIDE